MFIVKFYTSDGKLWREFVFNTLSKAQLEVDRRKAIPLKELDEDSSFIELFYDIEGI